MARKMFFALICVTAFLLFVIMFQSSYLDQLINNSIPSEPVAQPLACSLNESVCSLAQGELRLSFSLEPKNAPPLEPLTITIEANSLLEANSVEVWFEGRDMNMGRQYAQPEQLQPDGRKLIFSGMIPVCSVDQNMVWQLYVRTRANERTQTYVFELQSKAH